MHDTMVRMEKVCVCYTSDLQTSSIFTVDYYKGVAKSAADAGAHMIGIKVRIAMMMNDACAKVEARHQVAVRTLQMPSTC